MMSSATMLKYMMIKYFIHFAICNVSLPRHHEVSCNSSVGRFCTFDQMVYHLIIVSSCSKDFFHNLEKEFYFHFCCIFIFIFICMLIIEFLLSYNFDRLFDC